MKEFIFLTKLQAWRLETPSQMFFDDFGHRFPNYGNANFIPVRKGNS